MSYIVVVNPSILATPGTGISFSGALTATVLVCFLLTLMMGLYADLPFAVAPGMGINAFFTFSIILGARVPWPTALGIVFWSGVAFVLVSVTPLRESVARAIPHNLRTAVAVGIGLFLTFIGLKNAGLVVADPATFVRLGDLGREAALCGLGFVVTTYLLRRKSPLAFLAGIAAATAGGGLLGLIHAPEHWTSAPDFSSVFLKLDALGALKLSLLPSIVSIFFTDLFDSISTFVGVSEAAGLLDERGEPLRLRQGLIVDAFATLGAALAGSSSGTAFIESSAGIEAGGRTGLTSVFTALCFLPCLFLAPVAGMVPAYATAPVLILVGAAMFKSASKLSVDKIEDTLPAFLTVVLIPLTFSITQGILWGFLSHVVLYTFAGRRREVPPMLWGLSLVSAGLICLERARG